MNSEFMAAFWVTLAAAKVNGWLQAASSRAHLSFFEAPASGERDDPTPLLLSHSECGINQDAVGRICPECGHRPDTDLLIQCPRCLVPFVEESQSQRRLTHEQVDQIATSLVWSPTFRLHFAIALIISLILGVPTVVIVTVMMAKREITNRIARQFEEPRIRATVEEVAAARTTELLNRQIGPEVEKFRGETKRTLDEFGESLRTFQRDSTNALVQVRNAADFGLLTAQALVDDAYAFEELCRISGDAYSPFSKQAEQAVLKIIDTGMGPDLYNLPLTAPNWQVILGANPSEFSFQQLTNAFFKAAFAGRRILLIQAIFDDSRFAKSERLSFLAAVIRADGSYSVRARACRLMNTEAKLAKNLYSWSDLLGWWESHKTEITNSLPHHQ